MRILFHMSYSLVKSSGDLSFFFFIKVFYFLIICHWRYFFICREEIHFWSISTDLGFLVRENENGNLRSFILLSKLLFVIKIFLLFKIFKHPETFDSHLSLIFDKILDFCGLSNLCLRNILLKHCVIPDDLTELFRK